MIKDTMNGSHAAYSMENEGVQSAISTKGILSSRGRLEIIEVTYKHGKYLMALPFGTYHGVEHVAKDGAFGILFRANMVQDNSPVMIKKQSLEMLPDCEASLRELSVLCYFQSKEHPNVINLLDAWEYNDCLYLVLPLYEYSLEAYLEKFHPLKESQRMKIFQKILLGLHHLHENEIIHRDLKPENIVLSATADRLSIIDFGVSRNWLNKTQTLGKFVSTWPYRPPEAECGIYFKTSDIWSLGCILAQLILGRPLFDTEESLLLEHLQVQKRLELSKPLSTPLEFFFLSEMLKLDPEERTSAGDLLRTMDVFISGNLDDVEYHTTYNEPYYVFEDLMSMRHGISIFLDSIYDKAICDHN